MEPSARRSYVRILPAASAQEISSITFINFLFTFQEPMEDRGRKRVSQEEEKENTIFQYLGLSARGQRTTNENTAARASHVHRSSASVDYWMEGGR